MYIGTANKITKSTFVAVRCNGEVIGSVDNFKYLDVMIDNTLKFDKHTSYIRRKIFVKMKNLGHIRTFVTEKLALQLYKSLTFHTSTTAMLCKMQPIKRNVGLFK